MIKITANLTWCVPGGVGGSEEYLCRQLAGLPEGAFEVTVCAPRGFSQHHPEIVERLKIKEMSHLATSRRRRVLSESTWLLRQSRGSALVHHGGGTMPLLHARPTLLTIHDLQYRQFPQYFSRSKLAYLRLVMPRSAQRADLITVPTEFVKRTVIDAYGIESERIVVVPHGVGNIGSKATSEVLLRTKFELGDGPIVVMPAMTHPHKGHLFLLEVMERFWGVHGLRLVLIGAPGLSENVVLARVSQGKLSQYVSKLGRVSDADRNGLIAMATALVFPSEYEGFGAPVIEAMALGVPVITSDKACLPEVVGDAGLVLPLDIDVWAGALEIVHSRRNDFIAKGKRRLAGFTLEASGLALSAAYHRALA